MSRSKARARRSMAGVAGDRETQAVAAMLGGQLAHDRRALALTQQQLADRVGLSRTRLAELERGDGASAPLGTWMAIGFALGRPLAVSFSRPLNAQDPRDAGHLVAQELLLRLARRHGRDVAMELPVGRHWQPLSIDVVQKDRPSRVIVVSEIWNRMDDFGAGLRNHDRKVEAAEALAVTAAGDGPPYRVAACWVLLATAANRALVARYPEVIRSRFPGSSRVWVRCLANGEPPPVQAGIVWVDLAATRLFDVRLRAGE